MFWRTTVICVCFSTPIETTPKHGFWTLQQHILGTKMTVVRQNILSIVMLKTDKLYNGNVRLQLATPEICQARNSSVNTRTICFVLILMLSAKLIASYCSSTCKKFDLQTIFFCFWKSTFAFSHVEPWTNFCFFAIAWRATGRMGLSQIIWWKNVQNWRSKHTLFLQNSGDSSWLD